MKTFCAIFALAILASTPAAADTLFVTFDSPTLSGSAGDTVSFFGTITNTTDTEVFLNSDNFTLSLAGATIDDSPFFINAPSSLGAFGTSGDIGLFNITIPIGTTDGLYAGIFDVLGGASSDDQTIVGTAGFTINVQDASAVPEPGTLSLLGCGLVCLGVALRRNTSRKKSGNINR